MRELAASLPDLAREETDATLAETAARNAEVHAQVAAEKARACFAAAQQAQVEKESF